MYRFQYNGATLEIEGNTGSVTLNAADAQDAMRQARRLFRHMRDVSVAGTAERYVVSFKVDYKYRRDLLKTARRLARLDLSRENVKGLSPLEKYMALLHAQLTRKDTFLGDPMLLRGAVLALRNEIVRQGHVSSPDDLMDLDVVVYNLVESET